MRREEDSWRRVVRDWRVDEDVDVDVNGVVVVDGARGSRKERVRSGRGGRRRCIVV